MRDGPIGSHQELASAEKCVSSEAETEDVLWVLGWEVCAVGLGVGLVAAWPVRRRREARLDIDRREEAILVAEVVRTVARGRSTPRSLEVARER
jgi:hypothetical protein